MSDQGSYDASRRPKWTPQRELSRRLKLLLDAAVAERGKPLTFPEISEALAARGVKTSRARWYYMKDGNGRLVHDRVLLTALADFFNVSPEYLLDVEDMASPEVNGDQLEFVRSLRADRVKSFAQQTLGDVSPETLDAITEFLDRDIGRHPRGEMGGDSSDNSGGPPIVP
jgi:hypothetical protein